MQQSDDSEFDSLALTPERGCGILREPSGGDGLTDGSGGLLDHAASGEGEAPGGAGERGEVVGDANLSHDHRARNTGPRRRGESATNHDGDLGNPVSTGLEGWQGQSGDAGEELAPVERTGDGLGIFAPGPDDPRWQDVLVRNFGLRPALAQAEIEQYFRGLANGMADLVVSSRTDALRAEGNGVVAIQGAAMLRELGRRIIAAEGGER